MSQNCANTIIKMMKNSSTLSLIWGLFVELQQENFNQCQFFKTDFCRISKLLLHLNNLTPQ